MNTTAPGYKTIEHTADAGIEVTAETQEEAFKLAAEGLTSLMVDTAGVKPEREIAIKADGSTPEETLRAFLAEIAFLFSSEGMVFSRFDVRELSDTTVTVVAAGEKFNPERHTFYSEVKAVTYHELSLRRENDLWKARFIVDL